jgi:hypothetical protein
MNNALDVLKSLPDRTVIELQAIANDTRRHSWRIGRIVNEINQVIEADPVQYPGWSRVDVSEAVAICLEHEYSAKTIRDFASLESLFTSAEQQQFSDLPFSHFRFAATLGPRRLDALELSAHQMGMQGRPPSVDWLYHQFFAETPEEPEPVPDDIMNLAGTVMPIMPDSDDATESILSLPVILPVECEASFQVLRRAVESLSLPEWVKLRLARLLDEIRRLLVENLEKVN